MKGVVGNKTTDGRCSLQADQCQGVAHMEVRIWKMIPLSCPFLFTTSHPQCLYVPPDIYPPSLKTTGLAKPCKGGDFVFNG